MRSALFSSPHGDFSFSIFLACHHQHNGANRFRPLTGISLFLSHLLSMSWRKLGKFSSPHGDFSFSICFGVGYRCGSGGVFVPSRGFLFFYYASLGFSAILTGAGFRPLTGISLFLYCTEDSVNAVIKFSSPHGDFSFSMRLVRCIATPVDVFVPSRGFLFFYGFYTAHLTSAGCFRPLTGISLFLCVCIIVLKL